MGKVAPLLVELMLVILMMSSSSVVFSDWDDDDVDDVNSEKTVESDILVVINGLFFVYFSHVSVVVWYLGEH